MSDKAMDQPGSPTWWLTRTAEPDPANRGPGRPRIGRERILTAAMQILDEEGADALSMRSLATRLGSSTSTLYRHVSSKEEILAYVADRILTEAQSERAPLAAWPLACRAGARALFSTLADHPNAIPLFVRQVPAGPNALRAREQGIAVLLAAGFSPELAARGYSAIAHYVIGSAIQQQIDETADPERVRRLREHYRSLDARTYPATTAVADVLPGTTVDEEFEFGLTLIIDGLQAALQQASRADGDASALGQ